MATIDFDLNSSFCLSGQTPFQDVDPNSSFLVSSGDCIQMDIDSSHLTVKLDDCCNTRETAMVKYHPLSVEGNLVVHSVGTEVTIHGSIGRLA